MVHSRSEFADPWCKGLLTTASKTNGGYAYNFATVPLLAELLKLAISAALLQRQRRTKPEAARTTRNWRTAALFLVPSVIYWLHNNVQFFTLRCLLLAHHITRPPSAQTSCKPAMLSMLLPAHQVTHPPSVQTLSMHVACSGYHGLCASSTEHARAGRRDGSPTSQREEGAMLGGRWTQRRLVDPATYQILGNLKIVTTGLLLWACLRRQLSVLQWLALALLMIGATTSQVGFFPGPT